jgi:hypothetical protein
MSSFNKLLTRLGTLTEAKISPMDKILPGFQTKARSLAGAKGASSSTREGRLAMLSLLYDLDIIDDTVMRMFKNDSSVTRMVDYFEENGISSQIKERAADIDRAIKDKLEDKISFTTGNRTDTAQQKYEVNKLNAELRATKKSATMNRKKQTADAISTIRQAVDDYDDLIGSIKSSYSSDYMLEIVADKESDLADIDNIITYIKQFIGDAEIDVDGRSIDITFDKSTRLAKLIAKIGEEKVERQLSKDFGKYGGAGVVIHTPDTQQSRAAEDEEWQPEEEAEDVAPSSSKDSSLQSFISDLSQATGKNVVPVKLETPQDVDQFVQNEEEEEGYSAKTIKESTTAFYLTDCKNRSRKATVNSVSFREKYKPKTSFQLEELRSYGL